MRKKDSKPNDATAGGQSAQSAQSVENEEYYHGLLPREDILRLLTTPGHFLVRRTQPSADEGYRTVLSVRCAERPHHFIIKNIDNQVIIDKLKFSSVQELIKYHREKKVPITEKSGAIIITPVTRQSWELRHEQIELGKLLGEGAFGGVYAGKFQLHKDRNVPVAVKVHKGKTMTKKVIEEVCKEARIMRQYEHANIVKFYGVAIEREPIMLVMELVDQGALDSYLQKKGVETPCLDKVRMCCDAAKGLAYLHGKGCIHRDVAARNCLVSAGIVKISDFGLSKELSNREAKYKLKDLKTRLPIRWLAPETLLTGSYNTKSDVYAFGVLMWEIFMNGAIPYTPMTIQEVKAYVNSGGRLSSPDQMPTTLRQIMISDCFSTDPQQRSEMNKIRDALINIMKGRSRVTVFGSKGSKGSKGSRGTPAASKSGVQPKASGSKTINLSAGGCAPSPNLPKNNSKIVLVDKAVSVYENLTNSLMGKPP